MYFSVTDDIQYHSSTAVIRRIRYEVVTPMSLAPLCTIHSYDNIIDYRSLLKVPSEPQLSPL